MKPLSLSRFNPSFVSAGNVLSIKSVRSKETGRRGLERKAKRARKKDIPRGDVSFEIRKGEKKVLPYAFFTQSDKNKGVEKQVFARGVYKGNKFEKRKERYPIQALKSASPFGITSREELNKVVHDQAKEAMQKEFNRQIEMQLKRMSK